MKTTKPKRVLLDKDRFFESNRQKWTAILLAYSLLISFLQIKFGINPETYIQFALTIGSLFILGGSVDSFLKINAAKVEPPKAEPKNTDEGTN